MQLVYASLKGIIGYAGKLLGGGSEIFLTFGKEVERVDCLLEMESQALLNLVEGEGSRQLHEVLWDK